MLPLLLTSYQFVTNEDVKILRDIEQYYSTQIDEVSLDSDRPAGGRPAHAVVSSPDSIAIRGDY